MKWVAFRTMTGLHFWGEQWCNDLFSSRAAISPKMKKLESWWLMAFFSYCVGWSRFWGMLRVHATKIPTPLKPPTQPPTCPHYIPQNPDYPTQLLKNVINHQPSSFFTLGEIAAQLENKLLCHLFPKKMQTCHGTKCRSFHFILGRVNFTPVGKNYPH